MHSFTLAPWVAPPAVNQWSIVLVSGERYELSARAKLVALPRRTIFGFGANGVYLTDRGRPARLSKAGVRSPSKPRQGRSSAPFVPRRMFAHGPRLSGKITALQQA